MHGAKEVDADIIIRAARGFGQIRNRNCRRIRAKDSFIANDLLGHFCDFCFQF